MSATKETKTTTTVNGKKENYERFSSQILGDFITKGIHQTIGPNFKDEFTASENVSGQTTKQTNVVKYIVTAMGCIHMSKNVSATIGHDQRNSVRGLALWLFGSSNGNIGQEISTKGPNG